MRFPECHALANTALRQENLPILMPRFGFFCRARNGVEDALLALRCIDETPRPGRIDALFLRRINDGLHRLTVTVVTRITRRQKTE